MWFAILEDYVAKKVDEFLEDSIVPDIVLDVVNENAAKKSYELYSTKFRGEIQYVEEMVERTIKKLASEAVQETISGFANE